MTERLYYQDPFLKNCESTVLECRACKKGYEIRLDRTVFYPEGGGQPYDMGTLGDVRVLEVHEKEGEIWHTTKEPLEEGIKVIGTIDWERRFDLMQQHSGEHMLSGLIHSRFGYNNVGFHMGPETITVDVDGELTEQDLEDLELTVNRYVWEEHPIQILHPDPEELKKLPYRSKKELTGDVRIVVWPGMDLCACCGVHVEHSGQVGQIVIVSAQRSKGGMRLEMVCGLRALEYTRKLREENKKISNLLSAKWKETSAAVEKLQKDYQEMKFRMVGMELEQIGRMAEETAGQGDQLLFVPGFSADGMRKLAVEVMEVCGGRCAVFCGDDESGYRYAIGEKDGDLRTFTREMNQALNGRGGGKPFFVQGSVQSTESSIRKFFA